MRAQRARVAWAGVLAATAALALGHLVAGWVAPRSSPVLAVGNAAIDRAPAFVKDFAIAVFGTGDKVALLVGMFVVIGLLAVGGGMLSVRRPWPGVVILVVFGALGVVAVLSRPDLPGIAVLSPVASLLAGLGVFGWTRSRALGWRDDPALVRQDRRRFLWSSTAVLVGATVAGAGGRALARGSATDSSRRAVTALLPRSRTSQIPPGADFAGAGTPRFHTANRDFYRVDTALSVPRLRAEDWRLRIHGMVDRELVLGFDDLLRRRLVVRPITLTCVSNEVGGPLVSNAEFTGVLIRDLLHEAGVRPGAQQLFSTSSDGYTAGTPLDVLLEAERDALLAIAMNGEALPVEHGFPVRMVVPGLYGYVSATKWVVDAEVTTFDRPAYWRQRGWAREAPIKTQSRIDRPLPGGEVGAGTVVLAGIAWAQHTGIDNVEVRVDGGPWRPAELSTEVSRDTWRMWRAAVELPPGGHTVQCRATDRAGNTQTPVERPPVPDGATGWHTVSFTAR